MTELSRRRFLAATVGAAVAAACSGDDEPTTGPTPPPEPTASPTPAPAAAPTVAPVPEVDLPGDPFTLGVASGDPTDTSVILWTRLAPEPSNGGGMPDGDVEVAWVVAADADFADVVASGVAPALGALGHSVHVDAAGLEPDTWYHYRFAIGEFTSATGRTRTFPAAGASVGALRFGFSSCQAWEDGYYAAHQHAADDELDFFLWLGDYIYEYGPGSSDIRLHDSPEIVTLVDYRNRYALYRSDPALQANHASRPWVVTWDDHEVDNNYADDVSQDDDPPDDFLQRRADAYLAWYEHMPVRLGPPSGPEYPIHRDLVWGNLARFFVLDTRQYRDDQPTDGESRDLPGFGDSAALGVRTLGPTALDPNHTMLGVDQENWLVDGVAGSSQTWNVMAQQVFMHGLDILGGLTVTDTWDGYSANRQALLERLAGTGADNLVVLSGDFHSATVGDVHTDPFDQDSPVVATEFMASSISSSFFTEADGLVDLVLAINPQIKFFDARKGYSVCEVTPDSWTTTYRALVDPADPASPIEDLATFGVVAGTPGAIER